MDFGKDWDAKDTGLLLAALGSVKADIESTKDALRRGSDESNPFLGKKPSGSDLDRYGMMAGLAGGSLAGLLSPEYRRPMLGAWTGLEQGLAKYNREYDAKKGGGKFDDALRNALPMSALGAAIGYLLKDDDTKIGPSDKGIGLKISKDF